ncbi:outer membrane lipoprotein LolB [Curvibacter sp. CHRR-16]|uniref:lipoprotein insertase outer membrane protein LolB n=1 Tax=Curvibacter sp. CHRR-16 TaxID=2835872 RepID=UPI001BDA9536|nr:lipoprotein insertase outer membrane protein LolB [Curvibacter sp. CHRR-16]MBT0569590.1 outer membrane lipoprotein LolB [Curvibacter sp. CHRR-16]
MSIHIASQPPQSFSSGFTLQGQAERGVLTFYTPLGNTAAELQWAPGLAQWQQGRDQRHYPDLSSLLIDATGADLPVAALFDWLQGQATAVSHWSVDTSQLAQGRLRAQREAANGQPAVDVRVVLDR